MSVSLPLKSHYLHFISTVELGIKEETRGEERDAPDTCTSVVLSNKRRGNGQEVEWETSVEKRRSSLLENLDCGYPLSTPPKGG